MKEISLSCGYVTLVDDEDFELASGYNWYLKKRTGRPNDLRVHGRPKNSSEPTVFMHRLIMGVTSSDVVIDHRNRDGLDNRRSNLRVCTQSQNMANRPRQAIRTGMLQSRFKGVFRTLRGKWAARIGCNYQYRHIGNFNDEITAAKAYNAKAFSLFGEFALLNTF